MPEEERAPSPAPAPADAPADEGLAPVTDDQAPPPEIKAFIGGLAWEVTDSALQDEFDKYGIVSAMVATHRDSGRSRGFGFVIFNDEQGREDAIKDLHDQEKWGRRITVAPAVPRDRMERRERRGGYGGGRGGRGGFRDRGYGGRDRYGGGGGYGRDRYGGGGGGYGRDRPPRRYDDDRPPRRYDDER